MTTTITFHCGDVRDVMATMPDASVDFLCTSPPFLALRSYLPADHPQKHREIGSEPTPANFLDTLLGLSGEWRRLITATGSIAVEIGDTYSGSGGAGGDYDNPEGLRNGQPKFKGSALADRKNKVLNENGQRMQQGPGWPLAKSLCGIPTLYTWSLAYGRNLLTGQPSPAGQWRIRNLLTWTRPNPPVGALGDKFRPATSFVTVACISDRRWFDLDAVRTPFVYGNNGGGSGATDNGTGAGSTRRIPDRQMTHAGAPPLDWWEHEWQPLHRMPTAPYRGAHYATYPTALPERLILAMCPLEVCRECREPRRRIVGDVEYTRTDSDRVPPRLAQNNGQRIAEGVNQHHVANGANTSVVANRPTLGWSDCGHNAYRPGIVLDPFGGSGTTAIAAARAGRDAILIDLDHRNLKLTRQRIGETCRIVSEHTNGNTTRWTVEARLPDQLEQADGQTTLLDFL